MKRQEQLNEAWCKYMGKCSTEIMQALAFALRLADEHPDIDVRTMAAWRGGYQAAIEKACEWLERNVADMCSSPCNPERIVEIFRKAMNGD